MENSNQLPIRKEWGGIILSPNCINKCLFCNPPRNKTQEEIRNDEINVAKNIKEFKRKGIRNIEISGSDPIEYSKIISLIAYLKGSGFREIQLSTHGRRFSNKNFLKEIIKAGLTRARIPLYGSNAQVHDSIAGSDGSFKETFKAIKGLLKEDSINVQVSCLIMQQNKKNLINLVNLLNNIGVEDFYFSVPCVADKNYSYYLPFKKISPYLKRIYYYCKKINFPVKFMEIPYCVLGIFDDSINNKVLPPDLGRGCQPPKKFKTKIKDLPSYRIKTKLKMCKNCKCFDFCDGFFVNDVNKFGVGKLKPIK